MSYIKQNSEECLGDMQCQSPTCQHCCPHEEYDHGECIDCGKLEERYNEDYHNE